MANPQLEEAKRILKTADHMIYVTYPVLNESRLLMKILEEMGRAISLIIAAVLQSEYESKRIKIYSDPEVNFEAFSRCSQRYSLAPQHINEIKQMLGLIERHKKSSMGFSRRDKFVIMSENLHTETVSLENLKFYMNLSKDLLKKVENVMNFPKNYT